MKGDGNIIFACPRCGREFHRNSQHRGVDGYTTERTIIRSSLNLHCRTWHPEMSLRDVSLLSDTVAEKLGFS